MKLTPEIFNANADNLTKLAALFPSAVKDGELDIAALREELGDFTEVSAERYELTWAGKQAAKKLSQSDVVGRTLKFVPEDSKNADTTVNLYIEGDNLEVLKLLRQNYYGAVKMIYIDPPYNTGNDFVYRDDFTMSKAESDEDEGETVDGERMVVNQKSGNRYHANWLNMMYPRLRIAKDLLRDDGVIFISIDDNEVTNLRKLCDDVFGVENFVAEFIWKKKQGGGNDSNLVVVEHEYIVSYRKSEMAELYLDKKYKLDDNLYPNKDEKGEYGLITLDKSSIQFSQSLVFEIVDKDGNKYTPRIVKGKQSCWRWSKAKVEAEFDDLVFKNGKVYTKYYRPEGIKPKSLLIDTIYGRTESGNDDIKSLFEVSPFSYPKPIDLINHFSSISTQSDDIILDFFSGSATTAHAVMQLNAEDGGNRRFICVQFPETTDNPDYPTICEIGKERIRRAGDKIKADNPLTTEELDIGFRVFRTADTNIRWTDMAIRGEQIDFDEAALSDKDRLDFMPNFTDIDVVYEVLLRQRDIPLSAAVEKLDIGERVWLFADSYVVCLDEEITVGLVEALAAIEPAPIKYVLRDSAFNDDISLKDETIRRLEAYIARNSGEQKVAYTVEFI